MRWIRDHIFSRAISLFGVTGFYCELFFLFLLGMKGGGGGEEERWDETYRSSLAPLPYLYHP